MPELKPLIDEDGTAAPGGAAGAAIVGPRGHAAGATATPVAAAAGAAAAAGIAPLSTAALAIHAAVAVSTVITAAAAATAAATTPATIAPSTSSSRSALAALASGSPSALAVPVDSLFHRSRARRSEVLAEVLQVERDRVDPDAAPLGAHTPLCVAAERGNAPLVALLLHWGADPNKAGRKDARALQVHLYNGHTLVHAAREIHTG